MNLRKQRVPCQGISNFQRSNQKIKNESNKYWILNQTTRSSTVQCSSQNFKTQKMGFEQKFKTCIERGEIDNNSTINEIRKVYKGKTNIFRMAKSWKFAQRGYITQEQLKNQMERVMGISITDKEANVIMNKFGANDGKIDIQNFFRILYGETESFSFKPRLFDVNDESKYRSGMLDRLVDKIHMKNHEHDRNNKRKSQEIFIENNQDTEERGSMKYSLQKLKKSQEEDGPHFSKEEFKRLLKASYSNLRQNKKHYDFHPITMLHQNQAKYRFRTSLGNFSNLNLLKQDIKNEKEERHERAIKKYGLSLDQKAEKMRNLQRRLERIREVERNQKQNIQRIENKENERDQARIARKRQDREAYQYACYIKNSWL